MTNELKPCPFCGGEGTLSVSELSGLSSETSFYVGCDTCECSASYENTADEAIKKWNTRQPVFDWKPIWELTEEVALKYEDILFYMCNTTNKDYILASVTYDSFTKRIRISSFELDSDFDFKDDATKIFSWYALLTPPQTNQSDN